MKILIIEHAPHESPGIILDWIGENNYEYKTVKTYAGEKLTDYESDFLIIMGGPQSPLETDKYPYLIDEINFAKEAIEKKKYVLGICLGAQIISEALGNKTEKSNYKEYGFYPVEFTDEVLQMNIFEDFPKQIECLHWHNDMPGLGNGLNLLGKSEGCATQGVVFNERTIGFQFHMEIRKQDITGMIEFDKDILGKDEKYIMKPDEILSHDFELMNSCMKKFLSNFVKKD